ncbi:MAG: serine/threonine protein kinase, partial [Myxococcales bacterium]|nr:serine/threonine protein kinase [Myxococcales bacterium]
MICPDCGAGEQRESDTQCSQCGEALLLHARYQLLAVLGSNIGTTYLARDTTAGREVVVKELAFGKLDAWKTQELFEREMQVLRQLDHPLIPSYLEHFTLGQGKRQRNYLVLERVQGETLRDELEHRRYSEDDVLDVLDRVLSVLEYLQALHPPLIHRDIKPSNLIRMPDGRIALVDFGAVRDLLRGEGDTPTIAGTFGFMAPEQFRSEAFLQTDLYGLGGVALHLLARKPPDKMLASSMQLDWQRHVNVSPPMRALLERLLALEVSARPASASAARQLVA